MFNHRIGYPLLAAGILVIVAAALLFSRYDEAAAFHGTAYDDVPADGFTLIGHSGEPVSLADFRGRPVLLFFGFTHCPDICPNTLDRLTGAVEDAGRRADDTVILLVTVDPDRDSPEALARYVSAFGERVIGLTGDEAALSSVQRDYGVHVTLPESAQAADGHAHSHGSGTMINHSSAVYGIDRSGVLRVVIPYEHPEEWIRADIRTLARL